MDIVSRQQWGARAPKSVKQIAVPTRELWLHHTAGSGHTGASAVRAIQRFHMDTRGWSDIAYSFLVDVDGTIYEGRGPAVAGAHTRNHNSISHAICAMGDYQQEQPTNRLVESVARLVRHGHERGWWPQRLTGGHRDVGSTACPGQYLYSRIPEINRFAATKGVTMNPDLVIYAPRNIDYLAACAIAGARGGRAVPVLDKGLAQEALDNGVRVVAVGGPAARDLKGEVEAVGADALESLVKGARAA